MSERETAHHSADIAVIGMAGRFPKARSVAEFWKNLREGVECISHFSAEELATAGVPREVLDDPTYVKSWGWLEGVDLFDAGFFDIGPREAEVMDPQIRLILECAWEALEDSGYDPDRYPGRIGVFAGASMMFYLWQNIIPNPKVLESQGFIQAWIVNDRDFVATRLNYKLNLRGPGMTVQTACSTSLVTVHLACQSLLSGESDMVLAGGVTAPTPYKEGYHYVEGGTFSPDGHVRSFDAKAKGMLGGNGVALVMLKRLDDALADGDTIRAVIKGTALNNDGTDKVTYTAPSVAGQVQVILDTLAVAGVEPRSIGYVECHGTGTPLGDPIEISALTQAWRTRTSDRGFCPIGSVKTNVGHLDTTAGVAGLIKAVLALEHREIPPSLNYERPNPEIDFASSPFFVNTKLRPFEAQGGPRRAAVSSLGMGGTNAHAILEEAPAQASGPARRKEECFLVSARSAAAVEAASKRLAEHLASPTGRAQPLADVAFTLEAGRRAFRHRRAVVATSHEEAAARLLAGADKKRSAQGSAGSSAKPVAFLFSGQGSQYAGMTRGLYESEPVFRAEIDRCCELLAKPMGRDLRRLLYSTAGGQTAAEQASAEKELERTENTQPALFVVEWALAKLLESYGVQPASMLGHSVGEYVAASLAGVFTLDEALSLVAARGRLIGSLPTGGSMLAVHLSEPEVERELSGTLSIAAVNAPTLCVVSGKDEELAKLEEKLAKRDVSTRKLHTSHAFHSVLMDPVLAAFEAEVRKTHPQAPARKVVSCTTGRWLTAAEAQDPSYWVRHLRRPVRFGDGVKTLAEGDALFLEVGPGQVLSTLSKLTLGPTGEARVATTTRHPQEEASDAGVLLFALGKLWSSGAEIDWARVRGEERRMRVPLPTYPFEHKRYWIEKPRSPSVGAGEHATAATGPAVHVERKEPDIARWFSVPSWKLVPPSPALATTPRWLLFLDASGLGRGLARELEASGAKVYTAEAGSAFARRGERAFVLDPKSAEDHARLVNEIAKDGGPPSDIVHLWSVDPPAGKDEAALAALQDTGFFSLLFLGQALGGRTVEGGIRVAAVTSGLADVLADRSPIPERATVLGPCMAMGFELEGVRARAVDVEPALAAATDGPQRLAAELRTMPEHPLIALQQGRRWALTYEPVRLASPAGTPPALRKGAVVLVTGGLGGIGLALGETLAREVGAKLVLVGRSRLPDRSAWDAWIQEHGEKDGVSQKIRDVRRLESLGAEVLVVAADSTDERAMRAAVDEATRRFGAIHGIIHAAGIAGAGIIELKTKTKAQAVMAAKVGGTRILQRLFEGRELDFVLFCSSISSVCVGVGQVDYFAANAYMDFVAQGWRRGTRTRVVAANWDAWQEVGMAANTAVPDAWKKGREESLRLGIAPAEGREAFRRLLAADFPQVVVSPRELQRREDYRLRMDLAWRPAEEAPPEAEAEVAAEEELSAGRAVQPRPALATAFARPSTDTERELAAIWADLLGLESVGVRDNFFELGGNSLVMMQLNVRLRSKYGLSLPIRELFTTPEVALLAERIESIRAVSAAPAGHTGHAEAEETEEFTL
jgi:acyl transferase domain-containing protein/acyl carrier protein